MKAISFQFFFEATAVVTPSLWWHIWGAVLGVEWDGGGVIVLLLLFSHIN